MRTLGVLGLGLCALAGAGILAEGAVAATTTYYHSGDWRAFSGADEQNRLVCGMATGNPTDGRSLEIREVIGTPQLQFVASKPTWQIPPGTSIPVVMQESGVVPWTLEAKGQGHTMTWALPQTDANLFEGAFRGGSQMTISFPSGNEPPWQVSLTGSNAVDNTFRRCVQDYTARAAATAQPAAPSQPFGNPTTQPFAPPIATTPLQPPPGAPPEAPPSAEQPPPATPALPPIPQAGGH